MSEPLVLTGNVDNRDAIIAQLEEDNARLTRELITAKAEAKSALTANARAVAGLRKGLAPIFYPLKALFGEMEALGFDPSMSDISIPNGAAKNDKWELWKKKLGGKQAEFIAAMQEHGEMTVQQFKVSTRSGSSTIPQIIYKLNKLGLIQKNGNRYSLREQ